MANLRIHHLGLEWSDLNWGRVFGVGTAGFAGLVDTVDDPARPGVV